MARKIHTKFPYRFRIPQALPYNNIPIDQVVVKIY